MHIIYGYQIAFKRLRHIRYQRYTLPGCDEERSAADCDSNGGA